MTSQSVPLAAADVRSCVDTCQALLDAFDAECASVAETRLASSLLVALAAFDTVARTAPDDDRREPALLIAVTLGQEAATSVRNGSRDGRLLRCADECERAATLCQAELDADCD